jgi:four helix bundle protein
MRDFRKFQVREKAHKLNIELYETAVKFPSIEKYRLTDQLLRASISIPNNIAEECERGSDKDFIKFLNISNGSASEVEYLLEY